MTNDNAHDEFEGGRIDRDGGDAYESDLDARAACLINPASGLANDYLNIFNEVLLLIENLPILLPEMMADLAEWKPVTYREYFANSPLPGSAKALASYEALDPQLRDEFEALIAEVVRIASEGKRAVLAIQEEIGVVEPDDVSGPCGEIAQRLRESLTAATDLVNHGIGKRQLKAQDLADRLMKLSG